MTNRPKYAPRPDKTTQLVRHWLLAHGCHCAESAENTKWYHGGHYCGLALAAVDTSKIGGLVDWIIILGWRFCAAWECKEPGKERALTAGEREFENVMRVYVISRPADCEWAIGSMYSELR